jgi:hypothetical protein
MKEKLFGRGRRGGVLLIAGAVLGAAVAGPGATIAQKAMAPFNQKTADKRYVKRTEVRQAGAVEEAPLRFTSAAFTPVVTATIKTPGPGFLTVNGSLSAKDQGGADNKLQYRLAVGTTPLSTTPQAFELLLPTTDARQNGTANGYFRVPSKGTYEVKLEALSADAGEGADILGRSVNAVFTPKVKVAAAKKKKKTGGDGGGNVGP